MDQLQILNDRQKAVLETMQLRLTGKQSLAYLKGVGFDISDKTYRRDKKKIEATKLKRLYHIAQAGFEDQHLAAIDDYEMGLKMMWQNALRESDPYKCNSMIRDILLLRPYLSSYYEATKYIIEKQPVNDIHEEEKSIGNGEATNIQQTTRITGSKSDSNFKF